MYYIILFQSNPVWYIHSVRTQDEKQRTYPGGVGFHDEYKINSFDENTMAATCVDSLFRRKNLLDLAEICPDAQQVRTG